MILLIKLIESRMAYLTHEFQFSIVEFNCNTIYNGSRIVEHIILTTTIKSLDSGFLPQRRQMWLVHCPTELEILLQIQ